MLNWLVAASKLHKHRLHVALLSGPSMYSYSMATPKKNKNKKYRNGAILKLRLAYGRRSKKFLKTQNLDNVVHIFYEQIGCAEATLTYL